MARSNSPMWIAMIPSTRCAVGASGWPSWRTCSARSAPVDQVTTDGVGMGGGDELGHRAVRPTIAEVVEPAAHLWRSTARERGGEPRELFDGVDEVVTGRPGDGRSEIGEARLRLHRGVSLAGAPELVDEPISDPTEVRRVTGAELIQGSGHERQVRVRIGADRLQVPVPGRAITGLDGAHRLVDQHRHCVDHSDVVHVVCDGDRNCVLERERGDEHAETVEHGLLIRCQQRE